MELSLEDQTRGPWTIVRVAGELDLHTSPQLREHVISVVAAGARDIVLDLGDVGFMDSSSLGVLVSCLKRAREQDGRFVLAAVQSSPMKVLTLTGLDRVFEIVGNLDELPSD